MLLTWEKAPASSRHRELHTATGDAYRYFVSGKGTDWHVERHVTRQLTRQERAEEVDRRAVNGLPDLDAAKAVAQNWEARITA
jgi:hypothetical protein